MISNLVHDDGFWALPGAYELAVDSVVPGEDQTRISAWQGLDQTYGTDSDGKVSSVASRVLETAAKQEKLVELSQKLNEASDRVADWQAGKALLALTLVRQGKTDAARPLLQEILDGQKTNSIPLNACWIIGQELESSEPLKNMALTFYERALKDNADTYYTSHPVKRLVALYKADGRREEARALVLDFASRKNDVASYNVGYEAYRQTINLTSLGTELAGLGYPADAIRLFNDVLGDTDRIQLAKGWYNRNVDEFTSRAREGLGKAVASVTPETLIETARSLLTPRAHPGPDTPALDLMILVQPREIDQATMTSLFETIVTVAAGKAELLTELRDLLAKLDKKHPNDLSIQVVATLVDLAEAVPNGQESDPPALARQKTAEESVNRLVEQIKATPLEVLPAGARPNSRQRAEAARQIPLFLVARACTPMDSLHPAAEILADRALEAAKRQTDDLETLAILRERGQDALDRGDRERAEQLWTSMLDRVLTGLTPKAAKSAPEQPSQKPLAPTITIDRFEQAADLSRLLANRGMSPLSLKAMHIALRGGPPVQPVIASQSSGGGMMMIQPAIQSSSGQTQIDPILQAVEARLFDLNAFWTRSHAPPLAVYETLRDVVLPEGRPAEIFLYARALTPTNKRRPSNVGAFLVKWAVRAGQADDLTRRIESRQDQPMAKAAALVLRSLLGQALNDDDAALKALDDLDQTLKKDSLQTTAELACVAALPALDKPQLAQRAAKVVEAAARNLEANSNDHFASMLYMILGRHQLRHEHINDGQRDLENYLSARERLANRTLGSTSDYQRVFAFKAVADEYAQVGDLTKAL
ncbi:MAG: hypothetical protein ABI353_20320, partial [Isosphaeraceae bacterium]